MKLFAIAICLALLCISTAKAVINIQEQCTEGEVLYEVDLKRGVVHTMNDADDFVIVEHHTLSRPVGAPMGQCNVQGVLKLTYPNANNVQTRMLKFDLEFDSPSGYAFHIGDSPNNRGLGGDDGITTSLNAEVFSEDDTWTVHTNAEPGHETVATDDVFLRVRDKKPGYITNQVTIAVGDECIAFRNGISMQASDYQGQYMLAALRGQVPTLPIGAEPDYDIYVGINRLIKSQPIGAPSGVGSGLCSIKITALTDCAVSHEEGESTGHQNVKNELYN